MRSDERVVARAGRHEGSKDDAPDGAVACDGDSRIAVLPKEGARGGAKVSLETEVMYEAAAAADW